MFNIAICNDVNNNLKNNLDTFSKSNNFKYKLSTFNSFDEFKSKPPISLDVLFIDIDLSYKQVVFDVFYEIRSLYGNNTKVIFLVDLIDFVINGFVLKDFKYILKPFKYNDFEDEFLSCIENTITSIKPTNILEKTNLNSILYINSKGSSCDIHTKNDYINISYDIDSIETLLDSDKFFRCHDDYLVNLNKISKISRNSIVVNSNIIPVSSDRFKDLKNRLLIMLKII